MCCSVVWRKSVVVVMIIMLTMKMFAKYLNKSIINIQHKIKNISWTTTKKEKLKFNLNLKIVNRFKGCFEIIAGKSNNNNYNEKFSPGIIISSSSKWMVNALATYSHCCRSASFSLPVVEIAVVDRYYVFRQLLDVIV